MSLLKPVLITVLFFACLFFGGAMLLPSQWKVEQVKMFSQEPATVHRFLDDLEAWQAWVPWRDVDPTVRIRVGEPSSGVGAQLFASGDKFGVHHIVLTSSDPEQGITYRDETEQETVQGSITMVAEGRGTRVTWSVWGDVGNDALQRYRIFVAASSFAPDLERGLTQLHRRISH